MLEPKETNIAALFLVFIVLPLVTYFLLGKWSEAVKRKEKVSLIATQPAEEALRVEDMAVGSVIPEIHLPHYGIHQCARCFALATTRCSQCKSVWYCSGRCQIIHWRQVHKLECQQLGNNSETPSPKPISSEGSCGRVSYYATTDQNLFECYVQQSRVLKASSDDSISPPLTTVTSATDSGMKTNTSGTSVADKRSIDVGTLLISNKDSSITGCGAVLESPEEVSMIGVTHPSLSWSSKDAYLRENDFVLPEHLANVHYKFKNGDGKGNMPESDSNERKSLNEFDSRYSYGIFNSSTTAISGSNACDMQMDLIKGEYLSQKGITSSDETKGLNCSSERTSMKRSNKARTSSHSHAIKLHKSLKSGVKVYKEPLSLENIRGVAIVKDNTPLQESNRAASLGIMRMMGLTRATKLDHQRHSEDKPKRPKKVKILFPYEEFVKCFQFKGLNLSPRGLVNCGNSCYANAVLQCLTCTKPLITYLLRQSHSRAGCAQDWCLICELEQHVMMLRESGGPLSPINILMHIRSLNSQIGYGSQEDAHEFLRLLVNSMQSICLEGLGEENVVDPRMQDTTFIQHTFGGRLRSKVKCLRCHHESEQSENMMDLTLEIFGWVESLEDALTQFTSSEDLDGENMYRCGGCAAYVRAWKQLRIQEAPNILTIVLKRFQEGNYGKINKYITFPEMLDLIPFMMGTDDIPPLYMLYAVVVHLDTSNASFSGHYISYVKDLQGNWFKVDDTEVYPVELSQVMSEGAYILFYMRSYPRPAGGCDRKAIQHRTPALAKHCPSETERSSGPVQSKTKHNFGRREPSLDHRLETNVDYTDVSRGIFIRENRSRPSVMKNYAEFSDATSSDFFPLHKLR
ncbi:hypothetical protein Pfo_009611 [Paulownia fortunei]|nr:hypothetical protein Pfo_009611 [Paulownia fortunei]